MNNVQHGKRVTQNECNMKRVQHEKRATRKTWNTKSVQHKKVQDEVSAT